jgi:hypothetical protein
MTAKRSKLLFASPPSPLLLLLLLLLLSPRAHAIEKARERDRGEPDPSGPTARAEARTNFLPLGNIRSTHAKAWVYRCAAGPAPIGPGCRRLLRERATAAKEQQQQQQEPTSGTSP